MNSPKAPNRIKTWKLHTESCRNSDNQRLARLDLIAQIDFVTRGVLNQNIESGDFIADFDEGAGRAVERSGWSGGTEGESSESCCRCHYGDISMGVDDGL
jgi:hypothetical protein